MYVLMYGFVCVEGGGIEVNVSQVKGQSLDQALVVFLCIDHFN